MLFMDALKQILWDYKSVSRYCVKLSDVYDVNKHGLIFPLLLV